MASRVRCLVAYLTWWALLLFVLAVGGVSGVTGQLSFVFGRPHKNKARCTPPGDWGPADVGFQTPLSVVIGQQYSTPAIEYPFGPFLHFRLTSELQFI